PAHRRLRRATTFPYTTHFRSIRHHTSGSAGSEISLPRMAVKPHSSTHRWICSPARRTSFVGIGGLSPPLHPRGRAGSTRRRPAPDRKSTRLNSSHVKISYAVF